MFFFPPIYIGEKKHGGGARRISRIITSKNATQYSPITSSVLVSTKTIKNPNHKPMSNQAQTAPTIITYSIGKWLPEIHSGASREKEALVLESDQQKAKSLGLPKKLYFSKSKNSVIRIRYDRGPLFKLEKRTNHSTQHRDGILEVSILPESRLLIFAFKKDDSTKDDLPF